MCTCLLPYRVVASRGLVVIPDSDIVVYERTRCFRGCDCRTDQAIGCAAICDPGTSGQEVTVDYMHLISSVKIDNVKGFIDYPA